MLYVLAGMATGIRPVHERRESLPTVWDERRSAGKTCTDPSDGSCMPGKLRSRTAAASFVERIGQHDGERQCDDAIKKYIDNSQIIDFYDVIAVPSAHSYKGYYQGRREKNNPKMTTTFLVFSSSVHFFLVLLRHILLDKLFTLKIEPSVISVD